MKHQNSLIGKIEVQFYDKDNNLKKIVKGKNTVTHKGIKRICEILTQGLKNGVSVTESIDGIPLNTLIFSVGIAIKLKLTKQQIYDIALGAIYHDLGKVILGNSRSNL